MAFLSREAILGATAPPQETVAVPSLGGEVIVRGMSGCERDTYEARCMERRGKHREFKHQDARAKLVAFCCVDPQGNRLFSDSDIQALGRVRADVVDRLFGVAARLSGMSEQDIDELGLVSESPAVTDIGSSDSPESST